MRKERHIPYHIFTLLAVGYLFLSTCAPRTPRPLHPDIQTAQAAVATRMSVPTTTPHFPISDREIALTILAESVLPIQQSRGADHDDTRQGSAFIVAKNTSGDQGCLVTAAHAFSPKYRLVLVTPSGTNVHIDAEKISSLVDEDADTAAVCFPANLNVPDGVGLESVSTDTALTAYTREAVSISYPPSAIEANRPLVVLSWSLFTNPDFHPKGTITPW